MSESTDNKRLYGGLGQTYPKSPMTDASNKAQDLSAYMFDPVHKPMHYNLGQFEVIDYIHDKLTYEQWQGYCLGNCLKYISRYRHKGGKQDLEKAADYLGRAIKTYDE